MGNTKTSKKLKLSAKEVLKDYYLAVASREASLIGRKEVFMGKAKFGIFGDGKEVAQVVMAKVFRNGDFRSGYYRDQTFMFAIEQLTIQQYFAQLYAHMDVEAEPASAGRMMNGHFGTRFLDDSGAWEDLTKTKNSSSDISPTAAQMPRLLGLAYASKLYRNNPNLKSYKNFSDSGNEVAFGTIGNASTSEGMFWETMNAAGVLQVPLLMSVWDDDFGISVPKEFHTTKGDISQALSGFQRNQKETGFEIFTVKGWDYEQLILTYQEAEKVCREHHVPVLIHVQEMTQPQGHSTSGSHERYKSKERLEWEDEFDCNSKLRDYIIKEKFSSEEDLVLMEKEAKLEAKNARDAAWIEFQASIKADQLQALKYLDALLPATSFKNELKRIKSDLENISSPIRQDAIIAVKKGLRITRFEKSIEKDQLINWLKDTLKDNYHRFNSKLYSESELSALNVKQVDAEVNDSSALVDGREILQACFDAALASNPLVFAFGEDVGKIGDVNQGLAGLQKKYGVERVSDTSIRECTIIGQGIGCAMRGLRPIAEIQYLDYLLYAIQILSDDLATVQYRTKGGQKAPLIIRTRGHRLEGVWHSGSPMGMILNSLRGIYILTPRNMTQAAGMYNTMLKSDDAALIIEPLNGYRLKEKLPENIGEFTIKLGIPEVIRRGTDVSVVTYGSMCRIVSEAANQLENIGISVEIIDVQTLLPFDIDKIILESLKKTNRIVFADEDVPGGASAYMLQKVIEEQEGYLYLDSKPITISGRDHRPAYASDGDYFSKPNVEDVFDRIYDLMAEVEPSKYPDLY